MTERFLKIWETLNSIYFAEPAKLQLLAVALAFFILILFSWLFWLYRRPQKTHGSRHRFFGSFIFWFCLNLTLALLIGAWARPFMTKGNIVVKRGIVDVVFIVDTSASMILKDTGWARVDIASREMAKLPSLEILREGDRAAIFLLGITGLRPLPLSRDLSSFATEVSRIGRPATLMGSNIYWGSDIGATLEKVYNSLDRQDMFAEFHGEEPENWTPKIKKNRLVIFIGDGDYFNYDNDEEASSEELDRKRFEAGLDEFRKRGLKIYPIGIGTRAGAPVIDILKDYERGVGYGLNLEDDLKGQISRLNVETLENMRSSTGANRMFLIESVNADASGFLRTVINSHRSTLISPDLSQEKEELWLYFTIAALAIFVAGLGRYFALAVVLSLLAWTLFL